MHLESEGQQDKIILYKKKYNQDLTDDEIKALVDMKTKRHTQFINEQIARHENKN